MEEMCLSVSPAMVTDNAATAPAVEDVKAHVIQEVESLVAWILTYQTITFFAFETQLVPQVLALGRLFIQLFLCMRAEQFQATHQQPKPGYKRSAPTSRSLGTFFGKVRYTAAWFESAPVPEGDGEVLVIQIDSKATPTATEAELEKRRGKRAKNPHPGSQRHRGRTARQRRGSKERREKSDKAKNGKMATIVVM